MTKTVALTKGFVAFVDDEDFERVSRISWYCTSNGYAAHKPKGKYILMHRYIMGVENPHEIDHINRNKLDNRKSNLRVAKRRINLLNRKRYGGKRKSGLPKGVYKQPIDCPRPYYVRVTLNYRQSYLGSYATIDEAAKVAKEFFNENV